MSHLGLIIKNKCHIGGKMGNILGLKKEDKRLPLYKKGGSLEKTQCHYGRY